MLQLAFLTAARSGPRYVQTSFRVCKSSPGDPIRTGVARSDYQQQTGVFDADSIRRRVYRAGERVILSLGLPPVMPPSPTSVWRGAETPGSKVPRSPY